METTNVNPKCCTGCGACMEVCPTKCIALNLNESGFYVANKTTDKCIKCGKCTAVCPINQVKETDNKIKKTYIAVSKERDYYKQGASGGIVPVISAYTLRNEGVVWGCKLDAKFDAMHVYTTQIDELDILSRSKYVQSYMGKTIGTIKKQLLQGKKVLFVGTPCQVAGIRSVLKHDDNLYLIDIMCHGVPSVRFFKDNVKYIEKKKKRNLKKYEFRLKNLDEIENDSYESTYIFEDGTVEWRPYYEDIFFAMFYNNISLNSVCYECPFASENRYGDLTVGDYFWGKRYHERFKKYKECSCILVNTDKGEALLKTVNDLLIVEETKIEWIKERNKTLIKPTNKPKEADIFYDLYRRFGFSYIKYKYYMSRDYLKTRKFIKKIKQLVKR